MTTAWRYRRRLASAACGPEHMPSCGRTGRSCSCRRLQPSSPARQHEKYRAWKERRSCRRLQPSSPPPVAGPQRHHRPHGSPPASGSRGLWPLHGAGRRGRRGRRGRGIMPGTDRFRSSLPCRLPARLVTRHVGMTRPDQGADKASAKSGTTETAPCRGLYGCCPEAMPHFPSSPPPPRHLRPQASSCRPCAAAPRRIPPLPQHAALHAPSLQPPLLQRPCRTC